MKRLTYEEIKMLALRKYGYKEVRTLTKTELRALCIKEDWYGHGTNEEYAHLLSMTEKDNITTDDIVEMASDIIEHSQDAVDKLKKMGGLSSTEVYTHFMFLIAEACTTCFEEI